MNSILLQINYLYLYRVIANVLHDFFLFHFPNENETVLIGIGLTVHFEFRQFMNVAKAAIKEIFHEPTDVFWTGRAMDLMFNGIIIDCDVTNSLAKIACREIRNRSDPTFKSLDNGKLLFSMFGGVRYF